MKTYLPLRFMIACGSVGVALLVAGCSTYEVKVDAISRSPFVTATPVSYRLRSANPDLADDTLRYREAAHQLKTALSGRGLWEAQNAKSADVIVNLDYGIEPPHIVYTTVAVPLSSPTSVPGATGATTIIEPDTDLASMPVVLYEKHLTVSCLENRTDDGAPPKELWRVDAAIDSEDQSLRECLPVLTSVVMEQLGTTTDGVATFKLHRDDEAIKFIHRGL